MRFDRLPAAVRLGLYALAVAVLLYLCLAPTEVLPQVDLWDKAEHAIAWLGLAGLGLTLFPTRAAAIAGFALALGAIVEVLQRLLPVGRDADWRDWVADSVGVAVALCAYAFARRRRA